jgi:hypothetical protein
MVLEELPCINANWLSRRKLFPKDWSTRRYSFDFQNPAVIRSLTLGPRCAEFVFVTGQTQLIPIVWSRINGLWRTARAAFQCPGCARNAFKLYYHGGRFSGCYRCIGVPYASQQRSKKDRPLLQAARLKVFLGQFPDSTKTPKKPPLMHKRTYARLVSRLHKLEANSPRSRRHGGKEFSHKLYRPVTSYDSQRYALD